MNAEERRALIAIENGKPPPQTLYDPEFRRASNRGVPTTRIKDPELRRQLNFAQRRKFVR
jgi:hypothetical protein